MRRLLVLMGCVLGGAAAGQAAPPPPVQGGDPLHDRAEAAIARVWPALVRIHVVGAYYRDGREVKGESSGSGVIVSRDGYVVTNHHVAGRAKRLRCTLTDKDELAATLVGTDALSDIAVLKLDLAGRSRPLPAPAVFGDPARLRVGEPVLAMGSPLALSQSVTLGVVSNLEMTFPDLLWPATFRLDGEETGSIVRWIGHDAQIFPGNSGGPLVDLSGQVVGINEISFGLAGAIPADLVRGVTDQLIREGRVRRSWVGLQVQPLLRHEEKDARGVLVADVAAGSPADRAGIRAGDLLLSWNGQPLSARYAEQLPAVNRLMLGTPVGQEVAIVYRRDGQEGRAEVTTVARGPALGEEAELEPLGVTVRELTLLRARELRSTPGAGVEVTSVRTGSPAADARPPLQAGDILVTVAGEPVREVPDLLARTHALAADGPRHVLLGFARREQAMLTVVEVGESDSPDRSREARKGWLGVGAQVLVPDLAAALGLPGRTGVRVTQVFPGSPAGQAGIRAGDVLLELDGEAIPTSSPEDLEVFSALVRQYRVGAAVALEGVRDGAPLHVAVVLGESPGSARELREYDDRSFDFTTRDLTFQDRVDQSLAPGQEGALVTGVEGGGWAALAHLAVGDVVLAVDGRPVRDAAGLEAEMKRVEQARPARVVLFVRRGVHTLYLDMEPAWGPPMAPAK